MSHFTKIKCKINNRKCLLKTLKIIGFSKIEDHENPQNLYGFQGDKREETAEIIIRRKYIGKLSNDIGFQGSIPFKRPV